MADPYYVIYEMPKDMAKLESYSSERAFKRARRKPEIKKLKILEEGPFFDDIKGTFNFLTGKPVSGDWARRNLP